jgi:hypothetical protein
MSVKSSGIGWEPVDTGWTAGDIIWQNRMPGGECLLIEVWDTWEEYKKKLNEEIPEAGDPVWGKDDFPVLRVLHPTEGLIVDPSYYYRILDQGQK